ncbi:MAG TPA: VOC family protein, partial [Stellaceae bacterium]|nr:VOC family protein [Stellaceae bacterium]
SDIEQSHCFWTEILGFQQVGALRPRTDNSRRREMRFYSGDYDGHLSHHDIALVEVGVPAGGSEMRNGRLGLNHVAIAMPDRATWLRQLHFLRSQGVPFTSRVNRGVTHSVHIADPDGHDIEIVYELPRHIWEGNIQAALNHAQPLPTDGDAALIDDPALPVFGAPIQPAAEMSRQERT